jgi:hypothetical protein
MSRRSIRDPIVQRAMVRRSLDREARANRKRVRAALGELGAGTLGEIAAQAGLDRAECAPALDRLRILQEIELRDGGVYVSRERAMELRDAETNEPVPF